MKFVFIFLALVAIGAKAKVKQELPYKECSIGFTFEGHIDFTEFTDAELTASGCYDTSKNYTYVINARRYEKRLFRSPAIIWRDQTRDPQLVSYEESIDESDPLIIDYTIVNENENYLYTSNRYYISSSNKPEDDDEYELSACDDYPADGTWDYVANQIIKGALMPEGHCPIERGEYWLYELVNPIYVTFPKMIPCGSYHVRYTIDRSREPFADMKFSFIIDDDGNCLSQGSN